MTRKHAGPGVIRALVTVAASVASAAPPRSTPRRAAPFLAVVLRCGRAEAAVRLNHLLRLLPLPESPALLSALPSVRDAVSYNTVLAALCRQGCLDAALFLLRVMSHEPRLASRPNAVSYTTLMRALCADRRAGQAVGLLRSMQACGVSADVVTYGTLIRGLCDAADVDKAVELLNEMCESGIEPNVVVYSCLLQGYCKAGRWESVGKVFEEMSDRGIEPDVVMCTGLIDSLCRNGKVNKAARVMDKMMERGVEPNVVTYNVLINSMCKEGSVREVHSYYNFGPLSLCLSVNYLDRFLSTFNLSHDKSWMQQLMSVACLSLAVKMEETVIPLPVDLQVFEADYMFEARNIKRMELIVMETLNWRMNAVTPFSFMCYFLGKFNKGKTPSYMLASRCAELIVATVKDYRFLSFRPSEIAAAVALSALAETQAIGFSSALAASEIPVNKEMIVRCYELLVKKRGNLGASLPAPQSPIAVLDAACFSFRSDDITPGSSPLSNNGSNNDQASTPASKRRRLSTSPI